VLPGFVLRLRHQLLWLRHYLRPLDLRRLRVRLRHDRVCSGLRLQFVRPLERGGRANGRP